jgi:hypothetical protein
LKKLRRFFLCAPYPSRVFKSSEEAKPKLLLIAELAFRASPTLTAVGDRFRGVIGRYPVVHRIRGAAGEEDASELCLTSVPASLLRLREEEPFFDAFEQ